MSTGARPSLRPIGSWRRAGTERIPAETLNRAIALVLVLEIELEAWLDAGVRHRVIAAVGAVLLVAPILFRRRRPAAALFAGLLAAAALSAPTAENALSGMTGPVLPSLILAYTAGDRLELRRGLSVLTAGVAVLIAANVWTELVHVPTNTRLAQVIASSIVLPGGLWCLGRLARERSQRAAAFAELLQRVRHERARHEHDAAARERMRIGRELHDIIAQNLGAIVLQAAGARGLIGSEPSRAREAILTVERAGSEALGDLRRTLGLLRCEEERRTLSPQPSLAQLDALLDPVRRRGVECAVRIDGDPATRSAGVDLVGYRIVETALHLLRADHPAPVVVRIGYGTTRLEVEVSAGGRVPSPDGELRAIAERVALYDGTLQVSAPTPDSFAIHARLPLARAER